MAIDAEGTCEAISQGQLQQLLPEGVVLDASVVPHRGSLLGRVFVARSEGGGPQGGALALVTKPVFDSLIEARGCVMIRCAEGMVGGGCVGSTECEIEHVVMVEASTITNGLIR